MAGKGKPGRKKSADPRRVAGTSLTECEEEFITMMGDGIKSAGLRWCVQQMMTIWENTPKHFKENRLTSANAAE